MNRMEEYEALLQKLEVIPESAESCVSRAKARRSRRRLLWHPLSGMAAVLCLFIGLINLSPAVAAACSDIPMLHKLTEVLTFSPSLQKAVENNYIQPMGLEQTKNSITVRVEHVIVDQKQVNIFYSVSSDLYDEMTAEAEILDVQTGGHPHAGISFGTNVVTEGELRQITVDYEERSVPEQLRLTVDVDRLADFEFLLTFDPKFTAKGKTVPVDKSMVLDGNVFTVMSLEIYPTHIRINVQEHDENTAWLSSLRFYLELEDGTKIEPLASGVTAFGSSDTPSMTTYTAESTYFYGADCFRLVVTDADFRDKDFEDVYVNLETGETGPLPAGVTFCSAEKAAGVWEVSFLAKEHTRRAQAFLGIHDREGNDLDSGELARTGHSGDESGTSKETYRLNPTSAEEVWFEPNYTHFWTPEEPVFIEIQTP